MVADKEGNIWFTAISGGYIGKLDPKTGDITEYHPPDGTEIDPHTPVWYSESGVNPNTLVRFDPKTDSFSAKPIPSGGGVVRNMVATPDRRLYLACSGVNKVAVVDLNR